MTGVSDGQQPAMPPGWFPDPSLASTLRWWDGARWTDRTAPMTPPAAPYTTARPPRRRRKTLWIVLASVVGSITVLVVIGAIVDAVTKVHATDVTVTSAKTYTAYLLTDSGPTTTDSIIVPQGSKYQVYCHETTGINGSDKSFFVKVDDKTVLLIHDNQVTSVSGSGYPDCNSMSKYQSSQFAQDHKVYGVLATEH